jgi:hypothetical protein
MSEAPDVAALLSRGGWQLVDPQPAHRANPEGFWLPKDEQLGKLRRGSTVRSIFNLLDQADVARDGYAPYAPNGAPQLTTVRERMWSYVERVDGNKLHCILMNRPYSSHTDLVDGARFTLPVDHVIDLSIDPETSLDEMLAHVTPFDAATSPVDRGREPRIPRAQLAVCKRTGVKPHRPAAFLQLLVSKNVSDSSDPVYGVRKSPRQDRGDVGWTIWAGSKGIGETAKKDGFSIIRVQEIAQYNKRVGDYLALPPGWGFVLGKNDYEDIYPLDAD